MNKLTRKSMLLAMFCGIALNAFSQTDAKLTLQEAIRKGIDNSKQLKVSEAKVDAIKQRVSQSHNLQIPSLSVSSGYTRLSNNITPFAVEFPTGSITLNPQILNQYANRATLQHIIFSGFKVKYGIESAEYLALATELDAEKDMQDVKLNIINAYFNVLRSANSIKAIDSTILSLRSKVRDLTNQRENGLAIDNDVLRAEMTLNNSLALKADFVSAYETSRYNFALIIGLPTDQSIELDEHAIEETYQLDNVQNYLLGADHKRPDIRAQQLRIFAQGKSIQQNKSGYFPTLSVVSNYYDNRPNSRQFPLQDKFKTTWDAGLTLTWNLTSLYTNGALVKESRAVLKQNEYLKDVAIDNAKTEINTNYNTFRANEEKVSLLRQSLSQAKENRRVFMVRVENNMNLESDYLDAESQYLQAKINFINAQIDHQVAYYKLAKAIGQ